METSSLCWIAKIRSIIAELDFNGTSFHHWISRKTLNDFIVLFGINIMGGDSKGIKELKQFLHSSFCMKILGTDSFSIRSVLFQYWYYY